MMIAPSHTCQAPSCNAELPVVLEKEGLCLKHYLEKAFQRLAAATEEFQSGQDLDYETMDWLLAQVDFVVDSLGQEDLTWDPEQRSELLQLLLSVASLNEVVRHTRVVVEHSA
jgi:hypothetical protein